MRCLPIALLFAAACANPSNGTLDGERNGFDLQADEGSEAGQDDDRSDDDSSDEDDRSDDDSSDDDSSDDDNDDRDEELVDQDSDDASIAPTVQTASGSEELSIDSSGDPWIVTVTHGFGIGGLVLNRGTAWPQLVEFRFEDFYGLEGFYATASPEGEAPTVIEGAGFVQGEVTYETGPEGGEFVIVETLHVVLDDEVMLDTVDSIDVRWVDFYR